MARDLLNIPITIAASEFIFIIGSQNFNKYKNHLYLKIWEQLFILLVKNITF